MSLFRSTDNSFFRIKVVYAPKSAHVIAIVDRETPLAHDLIREFAARPDQPTSRGGKCFCGARPGFHVFNRRLKSFFLFHPLRFFSCRPSMGPRMHCTGQDDRGI